MYNFMIDTLRGSAWLIGHFSMMGWCCSVCTTFGGIAGEVSLSKHYRYLNVSLCAFPSMAGGMSGAGFYSGWIKLCAELLEESVEYIFGMLSFLGKKSTGYDIRSALFKRIYASWHM